MRRFAQGTGDHGVITNAFGKRYSIRYVETVFIDETTEQNKRSPVLIDITHS